MDSVTGTRSRLVRNGSYLRACGIAIVAAVVIAILAASLPVEPVFAQAVPVWRVTGEAVPSEVSPGGTGLVMLEVTNIGNVVSASGIPITVVDRLAPGMVAIRAGTLPLESLALTQSGPWGNCSVTDSGHIVTCTYQTGGAMPPISSTATTLTSRKKNSGLDSLAPDIGIEISVELGVSGPLTSAASVAGGGALADATDVTTVDVGSSSPTRFGLTGFQQWSIAADGESAIQAGSHQYETTTEFTLGVAPEGRASGTVLKDLHLELPSGFIGNPNAVPKCPRPDFDARLGGGGNPDCPADTQVGEALVYLAAQVDAQLAVYNLVPPRNMPAQFGAAFDKFVGLFDANVRPGLGGGYNVVVNSDDVRSDGFARASVTLWGDPPEPVHDIQRVEPGQSEPGLGLTQAGESITIGPIASDAPRRPFLSLPTSCGVPQMLGVTADSWEDPLAVVSFPGAMSTDEQNNPVMMEGCSKLDFSPSIEVGAGTSVAEKPAGLSVNIGLPQNEDPNGLREADLKNVSVTLPEGMTVSPSAANGLEACSEGQLGVSGSGSSLLFNESPVGCPAASKIGTVEVVTPLLEHPLQGALYLAQQEANPFNSLVALYLVAEGSGVLVKRAGEVHLNQQTGQVSVTFQNNPQVPLSEIKVDTFQSSHSSLMTPSSCGTYAPAANMTGWNGSVATPASKEPFSVNEGCSNRFSPAFSAGTANDQAGTFSPFSVTFSRQDGEGRIANASVMIPPGLSAVLKGVQRCPEPQASNGTCGPESQIGHATVAVGPGPEPFYAPGNVFLTGPYGGAPFGLSIVARAKAGPFDLGNVIVRARVNVDQHTAQITVTPDGSGPYSIPTILKGIPLDLRLANVVIDRSNFIFNPTSCSPSAVAGTITPTSGSGHEVSSPFQAAGCAKLPFKPTFTVSTQAKTSKADGASLTVKITKKAGEANLHKADLQLPIALPARLTTLQKACTEAQFNANPAECPPASVIGTAKVITPQLEVPVTGPAILVSHGGAAFPDVEFVLQGEGITLIVDGATDIKKGITYSKFETAPDAPFTSFETRLPEGPYSVLATDIPAKAKGSLCGQSLTMPTTLVGQNGAQLTQITKIGVSGCPKPKKKVKAAVHRRRRGNPNRRAKR